MALRSFADGALFAETFGDDEPRVLALHGWGRRGADFKRSFDGISGLAPDLPGFGASPAPGSVMGACEYAELILPLLDQFDRAPLIVGHSFGGRLAVCLAAEHPDRVGPLLLTGVPLIKKGPTRSPSFSFRLMRSLNHIGLVSDAAMERLRRRRGSSDYRAAEGVMRGILVKVVNESYEPQLQRIRSETLLLWGGDDSEVPVSVAQSAADFLEGAGNAAVRLSVIPGVGHHLPMESPKELHRAMVELLS